MKREKSKVAWKRQLKRGVKDFAEKTVLSFVGMSLIFTMCSVQFLFLGTNIAKAADGSGTMTVDDDNATAGDTDGRIFKFTFNPSEDMDGGTVRMTIPSTGDEDSNWPDPVLVTSEPNADGEIQIIPRASADLDGDDADSDSDVSVDGKKVTVNIDTMAANQYFEIKYYVAIIPEIAGDYEFTTKSSLSGDEDDLENLSDSRQASVEIEAADVDYYEVTNTSGGDIMPQTVGVDFDVTVTAYDQYGNVTLGDATVAITENGDGDLHGETSADTASDGEDTVTLHYDTVEGDTDNFHLIAGGVDNSNDFEVANLPAPTFSLPSNYTNDSIPLIKWGGTIGENITYDTLKISKLADSGVACDDNAFTDSEDIVLEKAKADFTSTTSYQLEAEEVLAGTEYYCSKIVATDEYDNTVSGYKKFYLSTANPDDPSSVSVPESGTNPINTINIYNYKNVSVETEYNQDLSEGRIFLELFDELGNIVEEDDLIFDDNTSGSYTTTLTGIDDSNLQQNNNLTLRTRLVDAAGNQSDWETATGILKDIDRPNTPTVSDVTSMVNISNEDSFSFKITGEDDTTYRYSIDDEDSETSSLTGTGDLTGGEQTITKDISSLSDGKIIVYAWIKDAAWNESERSKKVEVTKDATAPDATISYNPNRDVGDSDELVIDVEFTENMKEEGVEPTIAIDYNDETCDDLAATSMTKDGDVSHWTYTLNVPDCSVETTATVTITGQDLFDNPLDEISNNTFDLDNVAPATPTESTPVTTPTNDTTPNVGIKAESGASIEIKNSETVLATGTGNGATEVVLTLSSLTEDGTYGNVEVTATDEAGNVSSELTLTSFVVDTQAPTIKDNYAKDGEWVKEDQTVTLTPVGADTVKYCEGASCDPSTGTTLIDPWSLSYNLNQETIVRYQAFDNAENKSAVGQYNVKIDKNIPNSSSIEIVDTETNNQTFDVPWTAGDTTGTPESGIQGVKLYYSVDGGVNWTAYNSGNIYTISPISFTAPQAGTFDFYARAIDNANNEMAEPSGAGSIQDTIIAIPTTVYVDDDFSDGNDGDHTWNWDAYNTIQAGVDAVDEEGIVNVAAGDYAGAVVNKNVKIIGSTEGDSVIISGVDFKAESDTYKSAFRPEADGAEIRNFTITEDIDLGIYAVEVNNITVDSVTIGYTVQGITNWGGSDWVITNNNIEGTTASSGGGIGISVGAKTGQQCNENLIQNNTINSVAIAENYSTPGILLSFDTRNDGYESIDGNEDISGNKIINNTIMASGNNKGFGIEIGTILDDSEKNPANIGALMTAGAVHDNLVEDNIINGVETGIYFYIVNNLTIIGNEITNIISDGVLTEQDHKGIVLNNNILPSLTNDSSTEIDAEQNWWGSADDVIVAGKVSGNVDYLPFCGEETCSDGNLTNGIAPTLNSVTITSNNTDNNTLAKVGDVVTLTFTASETLIGNPTVTINGNTANVTDEGENNYDATYTMQGSDAEGALSFTIDFEDLVENDGVTVTEVTDDSSVTFDKTAPTVVNVTSSTDDGHYKEGEEILVNVTFDSVVEVTGSPYITLETGDTDRNASLDEPSGSGMDTLNFSYAIQPGDTSADLDYIGTGALVLNGGTIKDTAGNDAVLTLATPGTAGSLGDNKDIVVDTTAPVAPVVTAPGSALVSNADTYLIEGTAEKDALVKIYNEGTEVGSQQLAGEDTTYSISVTLTQDAVNNFTVKATDFAGNVGAEEVVPTITEDSIVPSVSAGSDRGNVAEKFTQNDAIAGDANGMTYVWTKVSGPGAVIFDTDSELQPDVSADTDGDYEVRLTVTDDAENVASDTFTFTRDTTEPIGTTVSINSGDVYSISEDVTLTLDATDNWTPIEMIISNVSTLDSDGNDWETFNSSKSWTLADAGTDGEKTVYVKFRDGGGNESEVVNDTIVLDKTDPSAPDTLVSDPASWSQVNSFDLTWDNPADTSDIAGVWYKIGDAPANNDDGVYVAGADIETINVSASAEGQYTVHVWLEDGSGRINKDNSSTVDIHFDGTAPSAPAVTSTTHGIETDWYDNNDPALGWSCLSDKSGITGYSYVIDQISNTIPDNDLEPDGTSTSYTDKADGTWYFHIKAQNGAGLWSATTHRAINIDTSTPSSSVGTYQDIYRSQPINVKIDSLIASPSGVQDVDLYARYDSNNDGDYEDENEFDWTEQELDATSNAVDGVFTFDPQDRDGWYEFYSLAQNNAGIWEGTPGSADASIIYDNTDPVAVDISSSSHDVDVWSDNKTIDFSWTASTDDTSGFDRYYYALDESSSTLPTSTNSETTLTTYTASNLDDGNSYWFHVVPVDNAGNADNVSHIGPFKIDTTKPDINHSEVTTANVGDEIDIEATVTDEGGSGVDEVELFYSINGGEFNGTSMNKDGDVYKKTLDARTNPNDTIEYYIKATDNVGKIEETEEFTIEIDSEIDYFTVSVSGSEKTSGVAFAANVSAFDAYDNLFDYDGLASIGLEGKQIDDSWAELDENSYSITVEGTETDVISFDGESQLIAMVTIEGMAEGTGTAFDTIRIFVDKSDDEAITGTSADITISDFRATVAGVESENGDGGTGVQGAKDAEQPVVTDGGSSADQKAGIPWRDKVPYALTALGALAFVGFGLKWWNFPGGPGSRGGTNLFSMLFSTLRTAATKIRMFLF